ncbi:MAG: glycosyl transferase [Pseudomonadota bacterium]
MDGSITQGVFENASPPGIDTPAADVARVAEDAMSIAYLGHDACDAAVRRRVKALVDDGFGVHGFMPRRRPRSKAFWPHTDLGETLDGAFAQRFRFIFSGAERVASEPAFQSADVIIARNLDMLAMAFEAKRRAGLDTPVIYECLDVHRLLTRTDVVGKAMRRLERSFVKRCKAVWVSSPGFLDHHFHVHHQGHYQSFLLENRLPESGEYGPRPDQPKPVDVRPLSVGWVGNLRCQRSFDLLLGLADQFGDAIAIHLHGQPARTEIPVFEPEIEQRDNVHFHGRYDGAAALARVYDGLDAVWAGDFMEAGANSEWLLPNRIYEGGYFGVPPIAPSGTQTAKWIEGHGVGVLLSEPLADTLPASIRTLIADKSPLNICRERLLGLPNRVFVEPVGTLKELLSNSLNSEPAP